MGRGGGRGLRRLGGTPLDATPGADAAGGLATTLLIKSGRLKWAWVTGIPLAWDAAVTLTASYQKVFSSDPRVGYFQQASDYRDARDAGEVLAPATDMSMGGVGDA